MIILYVPLDDGMLRILLALSIWPPKAVLQAWLSSWTHLKVFYSSWSEVILFFKIKRSLIDFLLKRNEKFQRANIIFALSCTLTGFMHVVWNLKWFSIYYREISKSKVSQHLFSFPEQKCCHLEFSINHGLQFAHPYTALPVHTKV